MTFAELLRGIVSDDAIAALGPQSDQRVAGVFDDSRRVSAGGVFIALRGARANGADFARAAAERGAALILCEDMASEGASGPRVIGVSDARLTLARLAARWHGLDRPEAARMKLLAVTGTNGKSTTAFMTRAILSSAGKRCGLLGTLEYDLCGERRESVLTTPGALELSELLRTCLERGADAVVLEASSHALSQQRCDGLRFHGAAFTNLTQDHLDYHASMEDYAAAKARLFEELLTDDAVAVVNQDDPAGERMLRDCRAARIVRYGLSGGTLRAKAGRATLHGAALRVSGEPGDFAMTLKMVGRHNLSNALAAIGLSQALDVPFDVIRAGLSELEGVPGRLQRVPVDAPYTIFVDYAHTPDALRRVGATLRPLTRGRLVIVFGCGGERDRGKRPQMAEAAAEFGDCLVVTSDNPRSEDPSRIIDDILSGLAPDKRRRTVIEPDRRAAIQAALAAAHPGDCVLIAGKGHETVQIIGERQIEFDDRQVAAEAASLLATG